MLFNSYLYLMFFLPLIFFIYYYCCYKFSSRISVVFLVIASLLFYGFWNPEYLFLILTSIIFNYYCGIYLNRLTNVKHKKYVLVSGIFFNLALLTHYKYFNFFVTNLNKLLHTNINYLDVTLPLGISFFTFTQIAFLIDCFQKKALERNIFSYSLFVSYFPHLLAGPIIHYKEVIPQFNSLTAKKINWSNIYNGLILIGIGLIKKALVAASFSYFVTKNYSELLNHGMTLCESWATSLGYSLQIYFDFSGYTDMAIGSSLLFNIVLPNNFNSPYKSVSIKDFWRRWHITLSRFLRDYLYIPLGGNHKGIVRKNVNILIVFLIGGLWHGDGWNFVIWGLSHGVGYIIYEIWDYFGVNLPNWFAMIVTMLFINLTFVFFRADSYSTAHNILTSMCGVNGIGKPNIHLISVILCLTACMLLPNSNQIANYIKMRSIIYSFFSGMVFYFGLVAVNLIPNTPFIYFQF